jgi:hypothetical protein
MLQRLLVVLTLLAAVPSAAVAADSKVKLAVLDLQERGVDKSLAASATSLLSSELQKLDVFRVISREDIRNMLQFEKDKQSVGCEADQACLAEIGGALGVEYIVGGSLAKIGDQYVLSLVLNNVKSATVENRTTENIPKQDQLIAGVARNARVLVSKVLKGREGFLVLTVAEEGATVKLDGQIRGNTPLQGRLTLAWGPHLLEVEKTGFITYSEDISIPARQAIAKSLALVPSGDFIERYEGTARKMRTGAWITTGLALVGAGVAIGFNAASASTENKFQAARTQYLNPTATTDTDALLKQMNDLNSKGSTQVFVARLGLGVGAAAAALATYFWIAGDDPRRYAAFREAAPEPRGSGPRADAGAPGAGFSLAASAAPAERGGQLLLSGRF